MRIRMLMLALLSCCASLLVVPALSQTCAWKASAPPAEVGRWMSAAAAAFGDGAVAFAGGTFVDEDGHFVGARNQVSVVRPADLTWTVLPNMTKRSAPAAAALNGRLYVFGGVQHKVNASRSDPDPTIKLALVESIGVTGKSSEAAWREESDMPYGGREGQSAVSLPSGRGIVLAGGFNSGTDDKGVFRFEYFNTSYLFDGKSYTNLPAMPFKRSNMALVASSASDGADWVFAMGGGETDPSYDTCAKLEIPAASTKLAQTWESCGPLVNPRSWMAAGVVDKSIVIAGGMGGEFSPTNEVDTMTLSGSNAGGNWTYAGCDLPTPAGFLSGAVASTGEFVVVAGDSRDNNAYIFEPPA